jgi:hypothetical protein
MINGVTLNLTMGSLNTILDAIENKKSAWQSTFSLL